MAKLIELSPCAGLLPLTIGAVTLRDAQPASAFSIAPFRGRAEEVGQRLQAAFGFGFPLPNMSESGQGARILWNGRGRALLLDAPVPDGLAEIAAITDQSDAAAVVDIAGAGVEAVLARLIPLDLRAAAFPEGTTARSLVGHMQAQITRTGPQAFEIMVLRSMAQTLVTELSHAAKGVAARG